MIKIEKLIFNQAKEIYQLSIKLILYLIQAKKYQFLNLSAKIHNKTPMISKWSHIILMNPKFLPLKHKSPKLFSLINLKSIKLLNI